MIDLVTEIKLASPEDLSKILRKHTSELNRLHKKDEVAIKAEVKKLSNNLVSQLLRYQEMLSYGNLTVEEFYNDTQKTIVFSTENVITNIKIALEYFSTTTTVVQEEPKIDWNKPVFQIEEVEQLLGVCRNTFKKYMDNGYLTYSGIGDKKWVTKENLYTFLSRPDIECKAFKEAKFDK